MPLETQDQVIFRGQTATWALYVTDKDGDAFDLTGSTLALRVKQKATDPDPDLVALTTGAGITHEDQGEDETRGRATVVMTAEQTALLTERSNVYDVWLTKASGERVPVVPTSRLTVHQGVNP